MKLVTDNLKRVLLAVVMIAAMVAGVAIHTHDAHAGACDRPSCARGQ